MHHFTSFVRPALKGKAMIAANQVRPDRVIKYFLLIAFLSSAAIGLNISGWLDPISFLCRSLELAIFPSVGNGLISILDVLARSDVKILNYIGYGIDFLSTRIFGYEPISFQTGWVIGLLFLIILFLNRLRPRFFCRVLCPLGALLGICSKFSVLRLDKKDEKCTHCGVCTKHCQGAASCEPGIPWQGSECLLCLNCQSLCPDNALTFRFNRLFQSASKVDLNRRVVLGGLLAGISFPLLGTLDGRSGKISSPQLIRPPGSLEEEDFLEKCQRCGFCMKACPTNVINPAFTEAGLTGFWTPTLIMMYGYCEYTCTLCGSVCPTGAIKEITAETKIKLPVRIGSAYVDHGRCLPWSGNSPCIVCEEHCPTSPKAIYFKDDVIIKAGGRQVNVKLPYVDLTRCVGCGICEYKCPVKGKPAIIVISAGESRSLENQILL